LYLEIMQRQFDEQIDGLVLAGGRSTRMGTDKGPTHPISCMPKVLTPTQIRITPMHEM
jgi:CTP:molybdopterin cytidylyltransferase MocA